VTASFENTCSDESIGEHGFLNGRKQLIDVLAGDNHDRHKDLFFYLFSVEMFKQSFARANSH
jgi:hypothetical protein